MSGDGVAGTFLLKMWCYAMLGGKSVPCLVDWQSLLVYGAYGTGGCVGVLSVATGCFLYYLSQCTIGGYLLDISHVCACLSESTGLVAVGAAFYPFSILVRCF